jgi:hypothetical protein
MSCLNVTPLRPELEKLPSRMLRLPVDPRGYVVPWFVDWKDGKPEFRAMSLEKWKRAVKEKRCWVCGGRMGRFMTFVAGPMCGINRTDEVIGNSGRCVGGIALLRNPGVAMLWTCFDYSPFPDGRGGMLLNMGVPDHVEWFCEGRRATRAEVLKSIEGGMPALISMAMQEPGAIAHLDKLREVFEAYLPGE